MFVKLHKLVNKLSCAIFELRGQHCLECSDYAKVTLFVWIPRLLPRLNCIFLEFVDVDFVNATTRF